MAEFVEVVHDWDIVIVKLGVRREWWTGDRWKNHTRLQHKNGHACQYEVVNHYHYIMNEWTRPS